MNAEQVAAHPFQWDPLHRSWGDRSPAGKGKGWGDSWGLGFGSYCSKAQIQKLKLRFLLWWMDFTPDSDFTSNLRMGADLDFIQHAGYLHKYWLVTCPIHWFGSLEITSRYLRIPRPEKELFCFLLAHSSYVAEIIEEMQVEKSGSLQEQYFCCPRLSEDCSRSSRHYHTLLLPLCFSLVLWWPFKGKKHWIWPVQIRSFPSGERKWYFLMPVISPQ